MAALPSRNISASAISEVGPQVELRVKICANTRKGKFVWVHRQKQIHLVLEISVHLSCCQTCAHNVLPTWHFLQKNGVYTLHSLHFLATMGIAKQNRFTFRFKNDHLNKSIISDRDFRAFLLMCFRDCPVFISHNSWLKANSTINNWIIYFDKWLKTFWLILWIFPHWKLKQASLVLFLNLLSDLNSSVTSTN